MLGMWCFKNRSGRELSNGIQKIIFKNVIIFEPWLSSLSPPTCLPTVGSQQETDGSPALNEETVCIGVGRIKRTPRNEVPGTSNSEESQPSLGLKGQRDRAGWPNLPRFGTLQNGFPEDDSHSQKISRKFLWKDKWRITNTPTHKGQEDMDRFNKEMQGAEVRQISYTCQSVICLTFWGCCAFINSFIKHLLSFSCFAHYFGHYSYKDK